MSLKYILVFVVAIMMSVGCLQTENSSALDGHIPDGDEVFLAVNQVFSNRCSAPCHDFHLQDVTSLISTGRVIPGDPESSPIYYRMQGSLGPNGNKDMPTFGTINNTERELIYNWIADML